MNRGYPYSEEGVPVVERAPQQPRPCAMFAFMQKLLSCGPVKFENSAKASTDDDDVPKTPR